VTLRRPPFVVVVVPLEGEVTARVHADTYEDERRLLADLEQRLDLLGEVAVVLDALQIALREGEA
jgi:hypothetical protein